MFPIKDYVLLMLLCAYVVNPLPLLVATPTKNQHPKHPPISKSF